MSKHIYNLDPLPGPEERIDRFRSVENTGRYGLGFGGRNPDAKTPLGSGGRADCSALAAWLMGRDRFQPCKESEAPPGFYDEGNGGLWIETTCMVADATRKKPRIVRALKRTEKVRPGDFVVFGDKDGKEGHFGMVLEVCCGFEEARKKRKGWGKLLVIGDCSPRKPWRKYGIQERPDGAHYFEQSGRAYFVRPVGE